MQLQDIEIQLWEYIDGQCNKEEMDCISHLISHDPAWKTKYEELLAFQTDIQHLDIDQPSLRFTQNVLDVVTETQIAKQTDKYLNHWVIRGIAAFLATVVICLLGYTFANIDWQTSNASGSSYTKLFSENALNTFIIINIVLSLILLDSLFRKKRQRESNTGL